MYLSSQWTPWYDVTLANVLFTDDCHLSPKSQSHSASIPVTDNCHQSHTDMVTPDLATLNASQKSVPQVFDLSVTGPEFTALTVCIIILTI